MPKRIVDGEGVWGSDRLRSVEPEWVRPEYANLIPLALSNGVFECSVRRVWRDVYGYNRPSMTEKKVAFILDALEKARLLFRFEALGKTWGYWVGIDKPGRLPSFERRGKNEKSGPEPPQDQLQSFLMDTKCILASQETDDARTQAVSPLRGRSFGFGLGSGLGSGFGGGLGAAGRRSTPLAEDFRPSVAHAQLAQKLKLDLDAEFAAFCDHHRAKGSAFRDWDAALRSWVRKSADFKASRTVRESTPRPAPGASVGAPITPAREMSEREKEWRKILKTSGWEAANAAVPEFAKPVPAEQAKAAAQ